MKPDLSGFLTARVRQKPELSPWETIRLQEKPDPSSLEPALAAGKSDPSSGLAVQAKHVAVHDLRRRSWRWALL